MNDYRAPLAYCQALEALAGEIPARAQYIRVVLLEMERLYNHVADFGMICNDTGFAAHAHCSAYASGCPAKQAPCRKPSFARRHCARWRWPSRPSRP